MLVPRNLFGMIKSCFIESDESFVGLDRFTILWSLMASDEAMAKVLQISCEV